MRLAAEISKVRKTGFTFAPEAGSERLREPERALRRLAQAMERRQQAELAKRIRDADRAQSGNTFCRNAEDVTVADTADPLIDDSNVSCEDDATA